jgi:hypothetical protein
MGPAALVKPIDEAWLHRLSRMLNLPLTAMPLFRLRYNGSATTWGFAIYRASHDDYENSYLLSGYPSGTPQEALDCACGLYLNDCTAWLQPPTN